MKTRRKELDVDFIGGSGPLTKEEEKRISDIIKSRKAILKRPARKSKVKLKTKKKATP
jgi:hypothetical protein